jgi:deoxyribonuclease IV
MRFGLHVGVSGGYPAAVEYAKSQGCTAMQIFSSNPRSYRTGPIDRKALERFAALRAENDLDPCVIHTPYLINLASDDPKIYDGSMRLLEHDLEAAAAGKIRYVNTHLGSYGKRDRNEGFVAICNALSTVLETIQPGVVLVMENSAGAGNLAGGTIEELGRFLKAVDHPQLGVCLDTAHAWAAGYKIDDAAGVDAFVNAAEEHLGLDNLHIFHFNDTEVPLGAARDRHHHIGDGLIGFDGFRALAAREELASKTAILETPGKSEDDERNMQTIRAIFKGAAAAAART